MFGSLCAIASPHIGQFSHGTTRGGLGQPLLFKTPIGPGMRIELTISTQFVGVLVSKPVALSPNDPNVSDARITWQELVFDFIGEFGIVKGSFEPHTRLSLLTRRFRDQSVKLLAAAGAPVAGLTRIPHLRCFSGSNAAGICTRRNFKCPRVVWGFSVHHCSNNSKRHTLAQNRPNAYYTPSWDFLPK